MSSLESVFWPGAWCRATFFLLATLQVFFGTLKMFEPLGATTKCRGTLVVFCLSQSLNCCMIIDFTFEDKWLPFGRQEKTTWFSPEKLFSQKVTSSSPRFFQTKSYKFPFLELFDFCRLSAIAHVVASQTSWAGSARDKVLLATKFLL